MALLVNLSSRDSKEAFKLEDSDYWLLYSIFEQIEDKTGNLIEPGEDSLLNPEELLEAKALLATELQNLDKKPAQELLLESDDERKSIILNALLDLTDEALSVSEALAFIPSE